MLSIVNDYSRKVWTSILKSKTFERSKAWKTLVENQIEKRVEVFRTDNVLEFFISRFDKICEEWRI